MAWDEVPGERLNEILSTHRPLCFDCLVAETFRDRFPDRIVEDPLRPGAARRGPGSAA